MTGTLRTVTTPVLDIDLLESGDPQGPAVLLLHGFPYDVHSYDRVAGILAERGARVIVPWLRGYGGTRFRSPETVRSGQQAAIGRDALELLDALGIERAVVAGYDWGGRAACVLSALHPERVTGLLSVDGYSIQNIAVSGDPVAPADEKNEWYVAYFQSERGRRGLERNRRELCRILWQDWSPTWADAAAEFERTAPSLDNPDFVDVVIHSYRHRRGAAPGAPEYADDEARLAEQPEIAVPTIVLTGGSDGFGPLDPEGEREHFSGAYSGRTLPDAGHDLPQEAPREFADAVTDLVEGRV